MEYLELHDVVQVIPDEDREPIIGAITALNDFEVSINNEPMISRECVRKIRGKAFYNSEGNEIRTPFPEYYCLVCDKKMGPSFLDPDSQTPVSEGLHFTACGNYGSTVFDLPEYPISHLEIVICDECVTKKRNHVHTIHRKD